MGKRAGGRAQHLKNAAQLHELKLDRLYKSRQLALMGQDFWRSEREAEPAPAPSDAAKPETVLESDWRGFSWEEYMDELRRRHESVSDA